MLDGLREEGRPVVRSCDFIPNWKLGFIFWVFFFRIKAEPLHWITLVSEHKDTGGAPTISTPGFDGRLMSGLLLAHVDGETRLNTPGKCKQKIFTCQRCGAT